MLSEENFNAIQGHAFSADHGHDVPNDSWKLIGFYKLICANPSLCLP